MRLLRVLYLLAGAGLLAFVVAQSDLAAVGDRLVQIGVFGALVIVGVFALAFLCDTVSWQLMLSSLRLDAAWTYRLWKVRMVGEAFNLILPAASFGGEPVKALLLKRRHGIAYGESVVSQVIARTTNLLALIVFAAIGFFLMLRSEALAGPYGAAAGAGLAALACGVVGFFAVQRWRVASRLGGLLSGTRLGLRIERLLGHIQDADGRFVDFYHRRPRRFAAALTLALGNWLLGTLELYFILRFLGHPIGFFDVWIVEAVLQLVRAGTFFIPANLGAVEVGLVLMIGALTGQPPLGLAAALVRRIRELFWITVGLYLGWRSSLTLSVLASEPLEPSNSHER